jgi:asparagine synthase (glutamine-hydrolysing)
VSAIFGIVRFDGADVSASDLERMGNTMAHRGPDGREVAVDGAVGLGHCLMRVNKEDMFEAQPLRDREGDLTLVADLRLDNREELAADFGIGAAELRDMPDSALVLHAYKRWGEDCAEHLIGDFAFAIWDGRRKTLVVARDHMGQRYVHYHRGKDFFVFATEAKALWANPGVPRRLSETMIGRYLLTAPSPASNATLFQDICLVFGGATLTVRADGSLSERRYWEPHADPAFLDRTEDEYIAGYRSVLTEAVECRVRRLIAPPALCLSAGYDSAAIAGLSKRVLEAQDRKLIAVSSVMAEDYDGPLPHARQWVELCRRDMPHLDVRYYVRGGESDFADLAGTFQRFGGIPDLAHTITDALFRQASAAGARQIMDGLGGDETLNPRGQHALLYLLRSGQFGRFLSEICAHRRVRGRSVGSIFLHDVAGGLAPLWLHRIWRSARHGPKPLWAEQHIAPRFAAALIETGKIDSAEVPSALHPYTPRRAKMGRALRLLTAKATPLLANLAAARGLDITRPMMDKRVVEFGQAIPENLYVKNGRARYLACRSLHDVYPREFQTRRPNQDPRDPNYVTMLYAQLAALKAEFEQLASNKTLENYIDLKRVRHTIDSLCERTSSNRETLHALRAFYAAKYIAWFSGENA